MSSVDKKERTKPLGRLEQTSISYFVGHQAQYVQNSLLESTARLPCVCYERGSKAGHALVSPCHTYFNGYMLPKSYGQMTLLVGSIVWICTQGVSTHGCEHVQQTQKMAA